MKESLLNLLAKRGIVGILGDTKSSYSYSGPSASSKYEDIMHRLIQAGLIFCPNNNLPLVTHFLPHDNVSPFHDFVVAYCIQHDLPHLLLEYIKFYGISKHPALLKVVGISLDSDTLPPPSGYTEKTWAKVLFYFIHHNQLFNPSIYNAQLALKVFIVCQHYLTLYRYPIYLT